jgi:hypothetical protein
MALTEIVVSSGISARAAKQAVNWFPQKRVKAHVSGNRWPELPPMLKDR